MLAGEWDAPALTIRGHEGTGIVGSAGEGATTLVQGGDVVQSSTLSCRRCCYCVSGRPVLCEVLGQHLADHLSFAGRTRVTTTDERDVHRFAGNGTFGQVTLVARTGRDRDPQRRPVRTRGPDRMRGHDRSGEAVNTAKVRPSGTVFVLSFDEVIAGFRIARGGAAEKHGVLPDLSVCGKAMTG